MSEFSKYDENKNYFESSTDLLSPNSDILKESPLE